MSAAAAAAAATAGDEEEWEVCNDRGFVYKRRRRDPSLDPGSPPTSPSSSASALRRARRSRRRTSLLNLRSTYLRELHRWDSLAASIPPPPPPDPVPLPADSTPIPPPLLGPARGRLIDALLAQVEAQEAVLGKVEELCDLVEGECSAREERMAEERLSLPVWRSPRTLVTSLSDR